MKIFLFSLLDDTFTALFSFLLRRLIDAVLPVYWFGFFHCLTSAVYPENAVRMHRAQRYALLRLNSSNESGNVPLSTLLRTRREPAPFWKEEKHEGQQGRPHMHCREGSG